MMSVETYKVQKIVLERFINLQNNARLAHAYLFVGPHFSGKFETAQEIAKTLNCESSDKNKDSAGCGACPSCVKIDSGNHPDVHVIGCEPGDTIKIEQIRDLLDQIRLKAFMAKIKIFIVKNVELLTLEAANALLKTLEEPTAHSLLILTTSSFENVLDTIKSRCHWIVFTPQSSEAIETYLKKEYALGDIQAHCLAYFAEGCLGKAKQLLDNDFLKRKNRLIEDFVFSPNSDVLLKEVLPDKEAAKEFLLIILSWVRDMILFKSGVGDKRIIHVDRMDDFQRLKDKFNTTQLNQIYTELVKSVELLNENLNVKMTLLIIKEMFRHG